VRRSDERFDGSVFKLWKVEKGGSPNVSSPSSSSSSPSPPTPGLCRLQQHQPAVPLGPVWYAPARRQGRRVCQVGAWAWGEGGAMRPAVAPVAHYLNLKSPTNGPPIIPTYSLTTPHPSHTQNSNPPQPHLKPTSNPKPPKTTPQPHLKPKPKTTPAPPPAPPPHTPKVRLHPPGPADAPRVQPRRRQAAGVPQRGGAEHRAAVVGAGGAGVGFWAAAARAVGGCRGLGSSVFSSCWVSTPSPSCASSRVYCFLTMHPPPCRPNPDPTPPAGTCPSCRWCWSTARRASARGGPPTCPTTTPATSLRT